MWLLVLLALIGFEIPAGGGGEIGVQNRSVLVTPAGLKIALSDIAPGRPVVVVVMKATWCPVCIGQLARLSERLGDLDALDAAIVGLSGEDAETNRKLMDTTGLRFDVLGEPERSVLLELGFGAPGREYLMPGLLFLDRCGDIAARYTGRRPGSEQASLILQTLERLSKENPECQARS